MTDLPIDYRNRPWRAKYIDEETPMFARWFVFGRFDDGTVSICSGDTDIFDRVPADVAEKIIKARNEFCDVIVGVLK